MFAIRRSVPIIGRVSLYPRSFSSDVAVKNTTETNNEVITHTGQQFEVEDYRRIRFEGKSKLVNKNFAVKLVDEDPIVVCEQRAVFSDGGGALGHPRVFINLDRSEVGVCGYSGRKFIHKKYYNKSEHGPSVTYEEYVKEMNPQEQPWPN